MPRSFLSALEFLSNPEGRHAQARYVGEEGIPKNSALNSFFSDVVAASASHGHIVTLTVGCRTHHYVATNVRRGKKIIKHISRSVFFAIGGTCIILGLFFLARCRNAVDAGHGTSE